MKCNVRDFGHPAWGGLGNMLHLCVLYFVCKWLMKAMCLITGHYLVFLEKKIKWFCGKAFPIDAWLWEFWFPYYFINEILINLRVEKKMESSL